MYCSDRKIDLDVLFETLTGYNAKAIFPGTTLPVIDIHGSPAGICVTYKPSDNVESVKISDGTNSIWITEHYWVFNLANDAGLDPHMRRSIKELMYNINSIDAEIYKWILDEETQCLGGMLHPDIIGR